MTEKTPEEITDDFLSHLDNGDYKILDAKTETKFSSTGFVTDTTVKDWLNSELTQYTQLKHDFHEPKTDKEKKKRLSLIHRTALKCVSLIREARMKGLIEERPSIKSKLVVVEQENERLRKLNQKLAEANSKQKKLIDALHKTIDRLTKKGLNTASGGTFG